MKTNEIIIQLINSIQNTPSCIYQIPWNDLEICLITEIEYRKELYPEPQFQAIKSLFHSKFVTLEKHILISDTPSIIHILEEFAFAMHLLPDTDYIDAITSQAHFNAARLTHHLNDTIIVLGDSHVNFFSGNEFLTFSSIGNDINICPNITNNPFTVLHLGPCLAYNCNKPNTSTQFHEKIDFLCNNFIKPNARIMCCLGEIDIRVHVFRQSQLQNCNYTKIVDNILNEYITFLLDLKNKGFRVYCWGPIASQSEACPVDPNFPRNGTEKERNIATEYFTHKLNSLCEQHKIPFLSIFNQMIDDNYTTLEHYLSSDHCHLSQTALALAQPMWKKELNL